MTKTQFIAETLFTEMASWDTPTKDQLLQVQQILVGIIFAADCLSGRAQIVHIPDKAYDDVCKSTVTEDDKSEMHQNGHIPWPMFAVELNHCTSHLALIVSTFDYLQSRAEDAQSILGIQDNVLKRVMTAFYNQPGEENVKLFAFIPSPKICEQGARDLVDILMKKDMEPGYKALMVSSFMEMDTLPYPIWTDRNGDAPSMDEICNLTLFVMSENVERKKVYEPSTEPHGRTKKKKKRKQCEAHIYEMGVEWSMAYDAYHKAMKSDPKGGHVRPHTRRGHFHRFRVGPRDGEVRYVTHWLPPTLVGDISKYRPSNQGHIIG